MASADQLIKTAIERIQKDVPALAKLKLVFGLELPRAAATCRCSGWRSRARRSARASPRTSALRLSIPRAMFNILAAEGEIADWEEAYRYGHLKVEGNPKIQQLIGQVVEKATARSHLRKSH